MKITHNEITWGKKYLNPEYRDGGDPYYFSWYYISAKDRKEMRKEKHPGIIGFEQIWYDGPHSSLNLYFFGFAWSTQWTKYYE